MPQQSDNTNPYIVKPFCTDTALSPDGVLQTDMMRWPSFLRRSTATAKTQSPLEIENKLNRHMKKRKKMLSPPTTELMVVHDVCYPSWITFRNLQNKYWTSRDSLNACIIHKRRGKDILLCYYVTDQGLYECLCVRDPLAHYTRPKIILAGDARNILRNDKPIQHELVVPFDSKRVIWCTHPEPSQ